jgi:hypothetical protein
MRPDIDDNLPPLERLRRRKLVGRASLLLGVLLLVGAASSQGIFGAFTKTTTNSGNSVGSAADYIGPTATRSVVGKAEGGIAGYVRNGGNYNVYAQITDTGNPASGVASANAVSGASSAALAAGSFTFDGLAYNWRTAVQTLPVSPEGTYTYQVDSTDAAANTATTTGFSFVIDNTAPAPSDIQTTNLGAIAGRPDINDRITYTFTEPMDPISVLAGWTGAQTNVVVRINNNAAATGGNDQVLIFNSANTTQLPLGSINLGRTDYVTANLTFGATSTTSKMTMSGNAITVTLGTQSAAGTTAATTGSMIWTPSATAYDRAANPSATTADTESGTLDRDF